LKSRYVKLASEKALFVKVKILKGKRGRHKFEYFAHASTSYVSGEIAESLPRLH
jgi:hypothetical protein